MIRPLLDCVVLKKRLAREHTPGGIVLPETSRNTSTYEVMAVGPGLQLENGNFCEMGVKVGDAVLIPSGATEIEVDGESYVMTRIGSIIGVLE